MAALTMDWQQVRERLVRSARPVPGAGLRVGAGIVDAGWLIGGAPRR